MSTYPIYPILAISNEHQELLWSEHVRIGETFILRYTHSVALTDVDEILRVATDRIIIDSSVYKSFGAGLPATATGTQIHRTEAGAMVLDQINQPVKEIHIRVGQVVADHRIMIHGRSIPLASVSEPGSAIRIAIKRESMLKRLERRLCHDTTVQSE